MLHKQIYDNLIVNFNLSKKVIINDFSNFLQNYKNVKKPTLFFKLFVKKKYFKDQFLIIISKYKNLMEKNH